MQVLRHFSNEVMPVFGEKRQACSDKIMPAFWKRGRHDLLKELILPSGILSQSGVLYFICFGYRIQIFFI